MADPKPKRRILLITRNFPPLTGGMERLMRNTARGMAEYANLTVVGPVGCGKYCPQGATVYEAPPRLVPFLLFGFYDRFG